MQGLNIGHISHFFSGKFAPRLLARFEGVRLSDEQNILVLLLLLRKMCSDKIVTSGQHRQTPCLQRRLWNLVAELAAD